MQAAERYLERMKILREGGTIDCPYCRSGKIRMINPAVYLCDNCGRGIVARVKLDLDKYIQQEKEKQIKKGQ